MPDEEHEVPQPPWERSPFVDPIVKLMMGAAHAISSLPNQFWGIIILSMGAYMLQYANERTLAIVGGIIGAGANLLTTGLGKAPATKKDDHRK